MLELGLIIACVVVFNLAVLFYKFYRKKYIDLMFDLFILVTLTNIFGGSILALVVGNIASFMMSVLLYFIPMEKMFPVLYSWKLKGTVKHKRFC